MKRFWRKVFSPSLALWVLILVLILGVAIVSYAWKLKPEQILSVAVAAAAIPIAFLTQRAILRDNQRQQLAQNAYTDLQVPLAQVNHALTSITISELDRENLTSITKKGLALREANSSFTDTYHSHEMVFIKSKNYFEFIHFSLMKLAKLLDALNTKGSHINGYGDTEHNSEATKYHAEAKVLASDIKSYLYDLKKELIEDLGFSKIFSTAVDKRKPRDKKYKTLPEVATKKAVKELEMELENGTIIPEKVATVEVNA